MHVDMCSVAAGRLGIHLLFRFFRFCFYRYEALFFFPFPFSSLFNLINLPLLTLWRCLLWIWSPCLGCSGRVCDCFRSWRSCIRCRQMATLRFMSTQGMGTCICLAIPLSYIRISKFRFTWFNQSEILF